MQVMAGGGGEEGAGSMEGESLAAGRGSLVAAQLRAGGERLCGVELGSARPGGGTKGRNRGGTGRRREWSREKKVRTPIGGGGQRRRRLRLGDGRAHRRSAMVGAGGKGVATRQRPSRRDDGLGVDEDNDDGGFSGGGGGGCGGGALAARSCAGAASAPWHAARAQHIILLVTILHAHPRIGFAKTKSTHKATTQPAAAGLIFRMRKRSVPASTAAYGCSFPEGGKKTIGLFFWLAFVDCATS
uniref:OSJNBa0005N02.8 protein n=1 Tax=Oryza sativa subsp. japonica TaxID=39947 RepID=Q7XUI4_ORYSJ|nr:OSJNBa0005N02.8 [Oryza sativa Japonica Group]